MTIGEIRNPWLRRPLFVLCVPPCLVLVCILGALSGGLDAMAELWDAAKSGWKEYP